MKLSDIENNPSFYSETSETSALSAETTAWPLRIDYGTFITPDQSPVIATRKALVIRELKIIESKNILKKVAVFLSATTFFSFSLYLFVRSYCPRDFK